MALPVYVRVSFGPVGPGNFTVAHGLGRAPYGFQILSQNGGAIWAQATPYDAANIHLVASDSGLSGEVLLW